MDYDDDVAHQSVQWLYDHARRPEGKPFLLVATFTHPHNPFTISREYWDLYAHAQIEMRHGQLGRPQDRPDALVKTGAADHTAIYRPTSLLSIHRCSVFQPLGHCS